MRMMVFKPGQADTFELLDGRPPLTPPEGDAVMFRAANGQLLVLDDVGVVRDATEADMMAAINGFADRLNREARDRREREGWEKGSRR